MASGIGASDIVFPHTDLTPITGKPNNSSLKLLKTELYANAMAVDSNRGGGDHGHLRVVTSEELYAEMAGEEFDAPTNPGLTPVAGTDPATTTENNRIFAAKGVEWKLYRNVIKLLKAQIIAAIKPTYLAELAHPTLGLANVSITTMLEHLVPHGKLTLQEVEDNLNVLSSPWNVDQDVETLFIRIIECRRIAEDANEPITEIMAIHLTLKALENTGLFELLCNHWRLMNQESWDFEDFKIEVRTHNEERERKLTAKHAGYHGANASIVTPITDVALNATTATSTNSPSEVLVDGVTAAFYCWSHGLGLNRDHTSKTCEHRKPGHKEHATFRKRLGGSKTIWESVKSDGRPDGR